jgi:hypothetical protein
MRAFFAYWRWLMSGRYKLWHLGLLGAIWIAIGAVIEYAAGTHGREFSVLFIGSGVAHWVIGGYAAKVNARAELAMAGHEVRIAEAERAREQAAARASKPAIAPPAAAPRIGADPFRELPGSAPVLAVGTAAPPQDVPVAVPSNAGNPDAEPKTLR